MRAPTSESFRSRHPGRWVLLASLLVGGTALAYVLPGSSVLRHMVTARAEQQVGQLTAKGTLTLENQVRDQLARHLGLVIEGNVARVDGVFSLQTPRRCRLDVGATDPGDPRRFTAVSALGKPAVTGPESLPMVVAVEHVCALAGMGGKNARGDIDGLLRRLKIDTSRTSLARFEGRVAVVLGNPAEGQPSFWVDKDTFQPLRLRWVSSDGSRWDVSLRDWVSAVSNGAFPRVFELSLNGQRQLRFESLEVSRTAKFPADHFATP